MPERKPTTDEIVEKFFIYFKDFQGWNPAEDLMWIEEEKCLYNFKDGLWKPLDSVDWLRSAVYRFLTEGKKTGLIDERVNVTPQFTDIVIEAMGLLMPHESRRLNTQNTYVALSDGNIVDMETWKLYEGGRFPATFYRLPVSVEQMKSSTPPTQFLDFLNQVLVKKGTRVPDIELIAFVQEMMGYILMDTTKAEATFFLVGSGSNGKSKLIDVIEAMLGLENVSQLSIETLTSNRFASTALLGKRLNTMREDESERVKSDVFKSLVTGETMGGERKYGANFSFRPRARYLVATNHFPTFNRIDFAIRRRLYIIPFFRRITDAEKDTDLINKLLTEIPAITYWALDGLKRLQARGYRFVRSEAMEKAATAFETEQSSALEFFDATFVKQDTLEEGYSWNDIYACYKMWCEDDGKKAKAKSTLIKELRDRDNNSERMPEESFSITRKVTSFRGVRGFKMNQEPDSWIQRNALAREKL